MGQNDIIKPDHVAATLGEMQRSPDKTFYVLSGDLVMEWEGYSTKDTAGHVNWYIVALCPRCHTPLTIDGANKRILVDAQGLHIDEAIRCTAPAQFGGMCSWRVNIAPPNANNREAIVYGRKYKIDAVAR